MRPSNYPPGVTGHEPQITGEDPEEPTEAERIGETLRVIRERSGYTVAEFAVLIECSRSHLANVEAGRRYLSEPLIARAAAVLHVGGHLFRATS